ASQRHHWIDTVSDGQLFRTQCAHLAAFALFIAALVGLRTPALTSPSPSFTVAAKRSVTVTPGDAAVERGSGLVVLARFEGPLPAEATLVFTPVNEAARRIPLAKNLNDPVFGGSVPEVTSDLSYRIEYANEQTRDFKVTIFEH